MRKTGLFLIATLLAVGVYAAQQVTFTQREVRDPRQLAVILAANAADVQAGDLVQSASITAGAVTLETNAFAVVFGAAPIVQLTYTEDPGDVQPIYTTLVTPSNFVANITSSKNYAYTATGTKP